MKTNIQEFILGEKFQAVLGEIKEIRSRAARIRKESWEMIRQLEPKIERLRKYLD